MTALTIEEKLIYRNIKRAAIVWLLLLRLDPEPITETLASDILQIDRSTARRYLKTLNELEICTRLGRYNGYILTDSGRQLALPSELSAIGKGKNSPSAISIIEESVKEDSDSLLIIGEGENLTFEGEKSSLPHFDDFPEIKQILIEHNIQENSRTRKLLNLLSTRDIHSTINRLREDPYHDLSETGLLITMLEGKAQQNETKAQKYETWNE